jgi:hypothetical protein
MSSPGALLPPGARADGGGVRARRTAAAGDAGDEVAEEARSEAAILMRRADAHLRSGVAGRAAGGAEALAARVEAGLRRAEEERRAAAEDSEDLPPLGRVESPVVGRQDARERREEEGGASLLGGETGASLFGETAASLVESSVRREEGAQARAERLRAEELRAEEQELYLDDGGGEEGGDAGGGLFGGTPFDLGWAGGVVGRAGPETVPDDADGTCLTPLRAAQQ